MGVTALTVAGCEGWAGLEARLTVAAEAPHGVEAAAVGTGARLGTTLISIWGNKTRSQLLPSRA